MHRTPILLILVIPCVISLSANSQNATLTNAVSSNSECEEEIRLIVRGMADLEVIFRFTDIIRPINASDFANEPSFESIRVYGSSSRYGHGYAYGWVGLNTTFVSVSEGKLKADVLMAKFEKLLHISLPYNKTTSLGSYFYKAPENASLAIQKFRDAFLECKPSEGFDKIVTPTLLEHVRDISFSLRRETGNLTWKTEVDVYIPNYVPEEWFGWLGNEYTISLKELADYSGNISASPYSTKSMLRIMFDIPGAFLQIFPMEEVIALETIPSQMEISGGGEDFEKDITDGSIEDLYIRFKWVMPWWSLIGVTVVTLGAVGFIIGVGINPLKKLHKKIPGVVQGFLYFVGFIIGCMSLLLIILNIVFLFNPSIALNQYGWMGFGVWLGIWIAIAVEAVFAVKKIVKKLGILKLRKKREAVAWELEDPLKELKEQLGRGAITQDEYEQLRFALSNLSTGIITQEEYEQKKKKLLEKSET